MNKIIKIYAIFFLSVFAPVDITRAYAQEIMTWEECVRTAKKSNPDLLAAAEKIKQARRDKDIAVSAFLPNVTSDANQTRSKTGSRKKTGRTAYSYSISGEQLVFDGFKTSSEVSNATKTAQALAYDYQVVSSNIRLTLRNAYIALMSAYEGISLTEGVAARRKQNVDLVRLRYDAGREHRGAVMTAEANLASAEYDVKYYGRKIPLAERQLAKALGLDKMKPVTLEKDFALKGSYDKRPEMEFLSDSVPLLKELAARKDAARYNLQSEQSDFFPQVYINTSLGRSGTSFLPLNDEWSAGMTLSYPIFEGGSRIAEVWKARSQLDQAKAEEKSGRDGVLVVLESAWKALQDSIDNVSVKKKFLEANTERAKIASAQYDKGLITFDDWTIIEDNLAGSGAQHFLALVDMLTAEANWVQAIGGTLDYDEK